MLFLFIDLRKNYLYAFTNTSTKKFVVDEVFHITKN